MRSKSNEHNSRTYLEVWTEFALFRDRSPDKGVKIKDIIEFMGKRGWMFYYTKRKRLSEIVLPNEKLLILKTSRAIAYDKGRYFDTFESLKSGNVKIHGYFMKHI